MLVSALLLGLVAGLRAMTAAAALAWAVYFGVVAVDGTWAAFLGWWWVPYLLTLAALGELVGDKLPQAPSRTTPLPFAGRVVLGGIVGAVLGGNTGALAPALAGAVGATVGTLLGYLARTRAAAAVGRDLPVALAEDVVAIAGAVLAIVLIA